jgi:two-component system, LytTR family, sensor kinase
VAFATPHWLFVAAASIIVSVQTEVQVRRNAAALPTGKDGKHDEKMIRYPGYGILFLAWTLLGSLSYAHYRLLPGAPPENLLFGLFGWLACYYAWLPLTPIIFRLEQRFRIGWPFSTKNAAILALFALPLTYVASLLAFILGRTIRLVFWHHRDAGTFSWRTPVSEFCLLFVLYAVTVAAGAFIRHLIDVQQKERQAAELALEKSNLEGALRLAELETLRMRLNPHFLFNCLQNISALAGQDAKAASQMLAQLGDLLRVALRSDYKHEIALSEEVALTKAYIAIEQVRHGDRLSVLFDIAPEAGRVLVPNLLLQPLVENAIKHGMGGRNKPGLIWVRGVLAANEQSQQLVLTIRDNGVGLPVRNPAELRLGVGLGATKERLMRMYDRQSLEIRPLPEGGTEVCIVLPAHRSVRAADAPDEIKQLLSDRTAVHHA